MKKNIATQRRRVAANPLLLLRDLKQLGRLEIKASTAAIPPIAELDPERCYITWDMILATSAEREAIRDVFIFVEDSCELTIDPAPARSSANPATVNSAASIPVVVNRIVPEGLNPVAQSPSTSNPSISDPVIAAAKAPESKPGTRRGSDTLDAASSIRVPAAKLDQFVNLVGELVTVQARLIEIAARNNDPALGRSPPDRYSWGLGVG